MSAATPAIAKPRLAIPLDLAVALLLIGAVLATGSVLAYHYYRQTSRLVLEASDNLFVAMGRAVVQEIERTTAPVQSLVEALAAQSLPNARNTDERMLQVPALTEVLRGHPALDAIYAGYDDGAFFLVRRVRDAPIGEVLRAPPDTAFVVQNVVPSADGGDTSFRYLRDDLTTIDTSVRPDFRFDPRARDWYRAAIRAERPIRTDPYVFFTTREPGITIARASRSGNAVVGADVTLENLSLLLKSQNVVPSTELFLLTDNGQVIAYRGTHPSSGASRGTDQRLPALTELSGRSIPMVAARFGGGARERTFAFDVGDSTWIGGFDRVDSTFGAPLYLATAAPVAELLEGAERIRMQGWFVTALLMVATIPLAWFTASRVSRPLRRLAAGARAMQAFDFGTVANARSPVREIDQLAVALDDGKATVRHFLDISGALAAERDVGRLVARVLDEVMRLAKADAGTIHLFDAERGALVPAQYARSNDRQNLVELAPIAVSEVGTAASPVLRAALRGETVRFDIAPGDVAGRSWLGDGVDRMVRPAGAIAIPLRNRAGEVDGVLSLLYEDKGAAEVSPNAVAFADKLSGAAAIAIETQQLIADQKALLEAFIQLIAAAIDAKSPYTGGHCQRVPELTRMLAQAACDARDGPFRDFSLDADGWEAVRIASWLHDCGKVTTPEYVVDKATKLETLYDRIHEVRMRFEVLKRDAEIAYWKGCAQGGDAAQLRRHCDDECAALDRDFAFVASCNLGGEALATEDVARLEGIASRTWRRTLDDRLGVSWEEGLRMNGRSADPLPLSEPLLADKPEHVIERSAGNRLPQDTARGFNLREPAHLYNRGELHNLEVARGTLTEEERYRINDHIVQTIVMLEKLPFPRHLRNVPEIAGGHHEKMDGSGYPRGLVRSEMSPVARMMAIADIFEALTAADRPYKKAKTLSEALSIMARMRGERHIDADLFELFLAANVHRRYAERFLKTEQIDNVDIASLIA